MTVMVDAERTRRSQREAAKSKGRNSRDGTDNDNVPNRTSILAIHEMWCTCLHIPFSAATKTAALNDHQLLGISTNS